MNLRALLTVLFAVVCLGAAGVAAADITTADAQLTIEVPDYVDGGVTVESDGDRLHYSLPHDTARIAPDGFDPSDVRRFGVEEDGASLTFNEDFGYYEFDASGNEGGFLAYWVVEEERQQGNETVTEEVRYEAIISVQAADEYEHLPAGALEQTREAADNWDWFSGEVERVAGSDVDVMAQSELAIRLLELRNNPFAALTGSFTALGIMLVTTLGGLLMLALFLGYATWINRSLFSFYNREKSLKADESPVEEKLHALDKQQRQTVLQNKDWQGIFDDDRVARAFRDSFGETVFDGSNTMCNLLHPEPLIRDRLAAMGSEGWVAEVEREQIGEDETSIIDADLVLKEDVDEDADTVDLEPGTEDFDAVVGAIELVNDELRTFDLSSAASHPTVQLENLDFEKLMEDLDVHELDFESTEAWGEYLFEFVKTVRMHEYTSDDGTPETTRHVLNQFLQTSQLLKDRYNAPIWEYYTDAIEAALVSHSPTRDGQQTVDTIIGGGEP